MRKLTSLLLCLLSTIAMQATALTFDVTEIKGGIRIMPSNNDDTYVWQLVNDESLAGMAKYIGKPSLTVEEYWQVYIDKWFDPAWDLSQGQIDLIYAEMEAIEEGEHTFIVAGCDEKGKRTSDFYKQIVTIKLTSDITFGLTVSDVKMTEVTIAVTPSEECTYYYDYVEASAMDSYSTEEDFARAYVDFLKKTYPTSLSSHLFTKADTYTFTAQDGIASGTMYYAFAVAINMADTTYRPAIKMVPFETPKQPFKDDFTFSFSYDEPSNKLTIVPSLANEYYYWALFFEHEITNKYSGSPEMAWLTYAPLYGNSFSSMGNDIVNLNIECMWDGTYYLTVAGYDNGQTSEIVVLRIDMVEGKMITPTGIDAQHEILTPRKILHNGQLYILRSGKTYDILGR